MQENAESLVLDCIPLAVPQAFAYVDTQRMILSRYRELFRKTKEYQVDAGQLSNEGVKSSQRYSSATPVVITTWQISFR